MCICVEGELVGGRAEIVEGAFYLEDVAAGYVGVTFGCFEEGVTEEFLDVFDVYSVFQEMGGEGVPKTVDGNILLNASLCHGFVEYALGGAD
ncbi:hypothetical protein TREAZ_2420 [Leadbettera azotonutricia ZAS-9]|uniref:Uncharacterized protein n=1 Tax=Leadbettera azotonutricia (strain ATCC BAA-888 / DSM 13862 / ZAS-9) TaxID=545695 RepID=F5YFU7_LEAAZ|nr:hypothetical protein TREAZ_2420 [Leadbettera azotonutricia ZAS-9]